VAKLLLDKGAAVDVVSKLLGDTALMLAARNGGHEAVAKLLLGKGASDGAANEDSDTALILAAQYGHEAVAALLLDKGAVVDAATKDGATARRGSRISTTACPGGEYGWTALMWAAQEGHEAVVKLLLDKGAAVDKALKDGHTALIIAAQKGHAAVAKVLLDKGAALRTSHAVKQRLCSVECGDGRVAAVDEDCRARRQQKPAHGLQLGGRDAQLLLLLLHCSAIFPVRLSAACVRQGVAHAVQAARRAGEARVGRVDFFRVRAIFASAARAFFPTRGNFGNHIFSGVLVPIISQEGSGF